MIDYRQLVMELEQQTAALEAAVLQREFDLATEIMLSRIALFEILISNPVIDLVLKKSLNESMLKIEKNAKNIFLLKIISRKVIQQK